MKRGDIGIALVLIVAVAWFGISKFVGDDGAAQGTYAVIEVNGKHYDTVALTEESRDIEIRTERGYNLLRVSRGGIEMIESDCPDQLCVGFGHIHEVHDTIVCLPNRVFVEVIGEQTEGSEPDAVVN
ncbi:NusG domain II-containing protein [Paenibacillus solani]|uniref:NusG domain II-containing protein n=1 Tax=Paenibacillus solani TaxID=1705565 RepID=UPI003D27EEA2